MTVLQFLCSFIVLRGTFALVQRKQAIIAHDSQGGELSVDLVRTSQKLLSFLKAVHASTKGELYKDSPVLDCAIRRYKSGWVPLLRQLSTHADENKVSNPIELIPPIDVAWIWHVHRLNPTAYAEFSNRQGINHESFDGAFHQQSSTAEHSGTAAAAAATRDMWQKLHGSNLSFFMDAAKQSCDAPISMEGSLPSSFLEGASVRQSKFLWDFLTPNYEDEEFLKGSEDRYVRWLQLKEKNPHEHLVPSVPIDLMWHAHMLVSPASYNGDIHRMGMNQLGHDDSVPQLVLRPRFDRTLELWDKEYAGTNFSKMVMGAPRRGQPSTAYWSGSLAPFSDAPDDSTSFLEANMEDAECMSACSSEMR